MNNRVFWLLKIAVAGLVAFTILNLFCVLYYNVPVHYDSADGATDYVWEKNTFFSRGTEGFAWGRTNNEGYLNSFDYSEDMPVDILVMGSSHMEAFQVAMGESTAAVLGSYLPDDTVYNIGTSSHNFLVCADNIVAAVEKYKPTQYVVLETATLRYTDDQIISAINETVPDQASYGSGLIGLLQKIPFLRLLYFQLEGFNDNADLPENSEATAELKPVADEALYDMLFEKLSHAVSKYGAELIVVYHPHLFIDGEGAVYTSDDTEMRSVIASVCQKNNAVFLDMTDIFIENYMKDYVLPHGFTNTSIGSGHLNKYGHAMIAEAVYQIITEGE